MAKKATKRISAAIPKAKELSSRAAGASAKPSGKVASSRTEKVPTQKVGSTRTAKQPSARVSQRASGRITQRVASQGSHATRPSSKRTGKSPRDSGRKPASPFAMHSDAGVVVIEAAAGKVVNAAALLHAFEQIDPASTIGVVVSIQRPTAIGSLVLKEVAQAADRLRGMGIPLVVAAHPKVRLLMTMFDLAEGIVVVDKLQVAMAVVRG